MPGKRWQKGGPRGSPRTPGPRRGAAAPRPTSYLDAAGGEVDLPFAGLGAGGRRFPTSLRSSRGREEPAAHGRRMSPGAEGHLVTSTWTAPRQP